jgi:hypothetical protein
MTLHLFHIDVENPTITHNFTPPHATLLHVLIPPTFNKQKTATRRKQHSAPAPMQHVAFPLEAKEL